MDDGEEQADARASEFPTNKGGIGTITAGQWAEKAAQVNCLSALGCNVQGCKPSRNGLSDSNVDSESACIGRQKRRRQCRHACSVHVAATTVMEQAGVGVKSFSRTDWIQGMLLLNARPSLPRVVLASRVNKESNKTTIIQNQRPHLHRQATNMYHKHHTFQTMARLFIYPNQCA